MTPDYRDLFPPDAHFVALRARPQCAGIVVHVRLDAGQGVYLARAVDELHDLHTSEVAAKTAPEAVARLLDGPKLWGASPSRDRWFGERYGWQSQILPRK